MDPGPPIARSLPGGLPRTRGDGPEPISVWPNRVTASPHPRGWTHAAPPHRPARPGFPAPAGMDPGDAIAQALLAGLPRTRGDGPKALRVRTDGDAASPHPRGWTLNTAVIAGGYPGFPAPAGMDPDPIASDPCSLRLPRTRGDGPVSVRRRAISRGASPHPRGWTRGWAVHGIHCDGFPAPAGMDPLQGAGHTVAMGLPRTRGDGPACLADLVHSRRASPHPRGWTHHALDRLAAHAGFPAPAGMDLEPPVQRGRAEGLPRTRGDGPSTACPLTALRVASPHPAGMDRRGPANADRTQRLPRTRGDGPSSTRRCWRRTRASPHPRGWTRPLDVRHPDARGFPAPAGMDPLRTWASSTRAGLPRTRGDGPARPGDHFHHVRASPHPRGWTLALDLRADDPAGFPAPAGMDP